MTLTEAKKILSGKLVFGNAEQIKARNCWEMVQEARDAILACDYVEEHLECNYDDLVDCDCIEQWCDEDAPQLLKDALKEAKDAHRKRFGR